MSIVPIILAAATVATVATAGAIIVFSTWEDIEANPSNVLRTLANNIENNPNRIKNLLYKIADDLITPDGLVMPGQYAREFIEVMLNQTSDTWNLPQGLAPIQGTQNFSLSRRIEDAVIHRIIFKSFADNIAQGPTAVATIVSALRSAADRVDAGIGDLMDFTIDLGIILTPNLPMWRDVRTNTPLPMSSALTPSQKQDREDVYMVQFQEEFQKEKCRIGSRGAGYQDFVDPQSDYTSANLCTLTDTQLVTRLESGLAAAAARRAGQSNRKTYRKVPY